jgi:hypothetical protein
MRRRVICEQLVTIDHTVYEISNRYVFEGIYMFKVSLVHKGQFISFWLQADSTAECIEMIRKIFGNSTRSTILK